MLPVGLLLLAVTPWLGGGLVLFLNVAIGGGLAGIGAALAFAPEPPKKPAIGKWGFDTDGMDLEVKAGDDFNRGIRAYYFGLAASG